MDVCVFLHLMCSLAERRGGRRPARQAERSRWHLTLPLPTPSPLPSPSPPPPLLCAVSFPERTPAQLHFIPGGDLGSPPPTLYPLSLPSPTPPPPAVRSVVLGACFY